MSQENVEIVRGLQPGPDVDLTELFVVGRDDDEVEAAVAAAAPAFTDDFALHLSRPLGRASPRASTGCVGAGWTGSRPGQAIAPRSRSSSTREIGSSLSAATSAVVLEWTSKCISMAARSGPFVTPRSRARSSSPPIARQPSRRPACRYRKVTLRTKRSGTIDEVLPRPTTGLSAALREPPCPGQSRPRSALKAQALVPMPTTCGNAWQSPLLCARQSLFPPAGM